MRPRPAVSLVEHGLLLGGEFSGRDFQEGGSWGVAFLAMGSSVMPAHSRSKNGVASLAYGRHPRLLCFNEDKDVDGRDKPGHDAVPNSIKTQNALPLLQSRGLAHGVQLASSRSIICRSLRAPPCTITPAAVRPLAHGRLRDDLIERLVQLAMTAGGTRAARTRRTQVVTS